MVWIVEYSLPSESETNVTLWSRELDARLAACRDILSDISSNWDLSDDDQREYATRINDMCTARDYKGAISEYNEWNSNNDCYEGRQFWYVHEEDVQNFTGGLNLLTIMDPEDDEDEEDSASNHVEAEDEIYQASTPGATCRGPCGNHNPDAYANKRDGTHVCYQCRMMAQVFGKEIK